jgi:hypothetical protein
VHLGFRSSLANALQETALLLFFHFQYKQSSLWDLGSLEDRVLERYRDEYRTAWSTPAMRAILSSSINMFIGCSCSLLSETTAILAYKESRREEAVADSSEEWRDAVFYATKLALRVSFE